MTSIGQLPTTASARIDVWTWSVRLFKTRSAAAAACRAGHIRVNGATAKPATPVRIGDEIRMRGDGRERFVDVAAVISRRVGAPEAQQCYIDKSPPPPPKEFTPVMAARDRGAGRPTKRERREIDQLRGR